MRKGFRQISKKYFSFSRRDRNGILVLMVLIVVLIAAGRIVSNIEYVSAGDNSGMLEFIKLVEARKPQKDVHHKYFFFDPNTVTAGGLDSFSIPVHVKRNIISYREAGGKYRRSADLRKIYGMNDSLFQIIEPWLVLPPEVKPGPAKMQDLAPIVRKGVFDPNTADAETLLQYGFNQKQVSTLINYRNKGGTFYKPTDLLRVYGVDSAFYTLVEKHIVVAEAPSPVIEERQSVDKCVELNSADSAQLVLLRGIGPVFAARIIRYRNLLGGFYKVNQLLEVYGFPEDTYHTLEGSFCVDTLKVEKIRLNFTDYSHMLRHPYFDKDLVSAILEFRQKNGSLSEPSQLLHFGIVDSSNYVRVAPYLTCR